MKKILLLFNSMFYLAYAFSQAPSIEWQKIYGGAPGSAVSASYAPAAFSIQQTVDGGYIVAGYSYNYNDNREDSNCPFEYNYLVVKLNSRGIIQWQKCLGGSNEDYAYSVQQTADGGYIVAGYSSSNDGDVTNNHGSVDYWVVKLDSLGTIQWQKCLGGSRDEEGYSIQQTADGGYIVAGSTGSKDGDVTNNHGKTDYWIVKLDSTGIIQWQKCLGGTHDDEALSIQQTADGGYIVAGSTGSNDGDVTNNPNFADNWVVKLGTSSLPIELINFNAIRNDNNAVL